MLKVLFDFEIDEKLQSTHSPAFYNTSREFFLTRLKLFELEIALYVPDGDYAVWIIYVTNTILKAIPLNIPEHLAVKIKRSITQQQFDMLLETLSEIEDEEQDYTF